MYVHSVNIFVVLIGCLRRGSLSVAQVGIELWILLSWPLWCWYYSACHPYLALKAHTKMYMAQLDRFSCLIRKQNTARYLALAYNPRTWEAKGGRLL